MHLWLHFTWGSWTFMDLGIFRCLRICSPWIITADCIYLNVSCVFWSRHTKGMSIWKVEAEILGALRINGIWGPWRQKNRFVVSESVGDHSTTEMEAHLVGMVTKEGLGIKHLPWSEADSLPAKAQHWRGNTWTGLAYLAPIHPGVYYGTCRIV
jgi:hypothetical protein